MRRRVQRTSPTAATAMGMMKMNIAPQSVAEDSETVRVEEEMSTAEISGSDDLKLSQSHESILRKQ